MPESAPQEFPAQSPPDLVPARMLNEWVYCPRLACLEWAQGEFEDSADTIEGRALHRRVDAPGPLLLDPDDEPEADGERPVLHARSVLLSALDPGIVARMDLVEAVGRQATPVDYKRGHKPDLPGGVWEPDLVQVGAQALVLRANGYDCSLAVVYYCGSKERVEVPVTEELLDRVRDAHRGLTAAAASGILPAPLVDSPKCGGCSLAGICLPDETRFLAGSEPATDPDAVRRLFPILPDAIPVYVQDQGAYVGRKGEAVVVKLKGETVVEVPLMQISHLAVFGGVQVTTPLVHDLCLRGIPICYLSMGGWFYGMTTGFGTRNVELRRAQFRRAEEPEFCLALARRIVTAKIRNQRTVLRRNGTPSDAVLRQMEELANAAGQAAGRDELMGIEGAAAKAYFSSFATMLKPKEDREGWSFRFEGRNRRPPRDPVNALLSLCYSLLAKDCGVACLAVGFDPHLGFFHTAHHGRQSLALDLMEEFRPILADSTVLSVINNGEVKASDFERAARAVSLKPAARKTVIAAYERRLDQVLTHPTFRYKVSYRKVLEVQARLLSRFVMGEIAEFPAILPR